MLELKQITKIYPAGDGEVQALKGVSIQFRKSDFVSILGQSGCGKTTMLNIVGGLDQYTSGDLVINGRSTKDFKDRDWDAYRNHSVGFVFQSYNLIPHQSVLQNVELALTLSGVSKVERRKRAKKALEDVGLGDQLKKRPGEMSGGQMQRVAIARALVNDPDIILADEPTGALDTETSVQVMEILKKVSEDRLVVMVTHNPDLAEKYSTRIIRMLDGEILSDTRPLSEEEYDAAQRANQEALAAKKKREKKPSMSFATAFMLSLKNLFTKKGRTILTAFAGSIGIIGIALILSVSQGTTNYIDKTQEDALSSYPITIQRTTMDMSSLMATFMNIDRNNVGHENDAVYTKSAIYDMMNALNNVDSQENDLVAFKEFLEAELAKTEEESKLGSALNGVQYSYDLPLMVYTKTEEGSVIHSDPTTLMADMITKYMGLDMSSLIQMSETSNGAVGMMGSMSMNMNQAMYGVWSEMLAGKDGSYVSDIILEQYDVVYGSWPNSYDEVVLVLDKNHELDDMSLYALGLMTEAEVEAIMSAVVEGGELENVGVKRWTYEEICAKDYRVILNSDCFKYDEKTGNYTDLRTTDAGMRFLYDNGIKLKVVGIIRPNEDAAAAMLSGSVAYTRALTEYVIEQSQDSDAIRAQMEKPSVDVVLGLPFKENTGNFTVEEKEAEFRKYIETLSETEKAVAYIKIKSIAPQAMVDNAVAQAMKGQTRETVEKAVMEGLSGQMSITKEELTKYLASMPDEDLFAMFEQAIAERVREQYAAGVAEQMKAMSNMQLAGALSMEMGRYTAEQCATYYDEVLSFSDSSYEKNLVKLGYVELENPTTINLFASSFANKEVIEDVIAEYNADKEEMQKIKYTDYIGIMLASVTTIIDAITYVLIAFVAISLVVSSIMIGVITLISVQERTKEIGILRAIGASKRNVSSMFTAETIIIGFASGLLGVLVTALLCIPINAIIYYATGLANLEAVLPLNAAIILVIISVFLTLIAGIIPAKSAAKKDPVVALRTE